MRGLLNKIIFVNKKNEGFHFYCEEITDTVLASWCKEMEHCTKYTKQILLYIGQQCWIVITQAKLGRRALSSPL